LESSQDADRTASVDDRSRLAAQGSSTLDFALPRLHKPADWTRAQADAFWSRFADDSDVFADVALLVPTGS